MTYLRKIRGRRPAWMILMAMMGGLAGCDEDEKLLPRPPGCDAEAGDLADLS